jgi:hypothetical protein
MPEMTLHWAGVSEMTLKEPNLPFLGGFFELKIGVSFRQIGKKLNVSHTFVSKVIRGLR